MTDKVQRIKEWISKTQDGLMDANGNFGYLEHEGAYHILCNLNAYIDSLQEEPKKCMYSTANYTNGDRLTLCKNCKELCRYNQKTAAESLGISQEAYDEIVDKCLYGSEVELVNNGDLPKEEPKAKFKVGDNVMYLNEEYVITDNKKHYTLRSTKERTSVPVVHIDFGNEDYELRLVEESKKCMYSKDNYTDEDRKVLCDGCEEECKFNKKEEPVNDSFEAEVKKLWEEINTGHNYSIVDSYNQFYGLCMEIAEWQKEQMMAKAVDATVHIKIKKYE